MKEIIMTELTLQDKALDVKEFKRIAFAFKKLVNELPAAQEANVKSLLFYKAINAIAAVEAAIINEFEVKVIRGIIENSDTWLEALNQGSISRQMVEKLLNLLKEQPIFSSTAPGAAIVPEVVVPDNAEAKQAWIKEKIADFENQAVIFNEQFKPNPGILAYSLHHLFYNQEDIKRFYEEQRESLLNNGDALYTHGDLHMHLQNSIRYDREKKIIVEWKNVQELIEGILCSTLNMFARAQEWQKVDGTPEKMRELFGMFEGFCIELRTRKLFESPPEWVFMVSPETTLSLAEKVKAIAEKHEVYFSSNKYELDDAELSELVSYWFKGRNYLENDEERPITLEQIRPLITEMNTPILVEDKSEGNSPDSSPLSRRNSFFLDPAASSSSGDSVTEQSKIQPK